MKKGESAFTGTPNPGKKTTGISDHASGTSLAGDDLFFSEYDTRKRLFFGLSVIAAGVIIAGFWNFHLVDGFGRDIIAGRTIGDTGALSGAFGDLGGGFGFVFAAIAGLAATFTACNCVAFAMLPGLVCRGDRQSTRRAAIRSITAFVAPVLLTGAAYRIFIGFLGPDGVAVINERAVRLAQAQAVFTMIGMVMLIWGLVELGFLQKYTRRFSPLTREFFSTPSTRAFMLGSLVGLFAV